MAKIDFDTKNIGKQIHDDGEFELPANLHSGVGQDLTLPSRFGINKSEDPIIIFDRFPGWTDDAVKTELNRIWETDVWPGRVSQFLAAAEQIKAIELPTNKPEYVKKNKAITAKVGLSKFSKS